MSNYPADFSETGPYFMAVIAVSALAPIAVLLCLMPRSLEKCVGVYTGSTGALDHWEEEVLRECITGFRS